MLPQTRLYTVEDYYLLPNDGRRFELIDGELIEKDGEGIGQDRPFTVGGLDYLPAEGPRYEILQGVLIPLPPPDGQHQRVLLTILRALDRFVTETAAGEVIVAPPWVVLSEFDIALPDLVFISGGRAEIVAPGRIAGALDLVVEISMLPTIDRDLGRKNWIYRQAGVREYWTVNLAERDVAVRAFADTHDDRPVTFVRDGLLTSTILPVFAVDVKEHFAQA